jgi:hypothetical protein
VHDAQRDRRALHAIIMASRRVDDTIDQERASRREGNDLRSEPG